MTRGIFIVFEGIDGCGKSTQIKKFVDYLFSKDKHNHIIFTRNPYKDTNIRAILREENDPLTQSDKLANLFIGDRKLQVEELIKHNLANGHIIVCDRYKLSTVAYQGAQGIVLQDLIDRHEGFPIPDMTFVIDVSSEVASKRMGDDEDRNEHKFEANLDFLEKTRENYLKSKDLLPNEKIFIIEGDRDIETIFEKIKEIFERELRICSEIQFSPSPCKNRKFYKGKF